MQDITEPLTQAIESCKQRALSEFVDHLMPVLEQKSFNFSDLLEALTHYARKQPGWSDVAQHLEDAYCELR